MSSNDQKTFTCNNNKPTTIESVKSKQNAAAADFDAISAICAKDLEFEIKGENFRDPESVNICDTPCIGIKQLSATTITCKLGENVEDVGATNKSCDVFVKQSSGNAEMKASDANSFTCLP